MYTIYYASKDSGKKMYLVDLPNDENWLSGIGFQSDKKAAGTCLARQDAEKLIIWLEDEISGRAYEIEGEDE